MARFAKKIVAQNNEQPEAKPIKDKPIDVAPVEIAPAVAKPIDTKPVEVKLVEVKPGVSIEQPKDLKYKIVKGLTLSWKGQIITLHENDVIDFMGYGSNAHDEFTKAGAVFEKV